MSSNPISQAAYAHAAAELHPSILAHSLRVHLHATQISKQEDLNWHTDSKQSTLLFVACIFHDLGTSSTYDTGPTRFEIEGADAAVNFLKQYPTITEAERHEVWTAIAIHDTPQIAERISVLPRLVRLGVTIDFKRPAALAMVSEKWVKHVETEFPRVEIEKVLGDAVVEQALKVPEKAPAACWPGLLLRAKLADPEWEGVNKAF
ncbi:unnamed protein product [Zymoseptoria tritici ST99CH_3D1]|uniref:HD domain-containing protein n=1 Tax=Zymoseptoria tritici (strain CBS 115943 / IPO323) TaxID=336722 RepID=F9WX40_ZYMTI|nr:uncharacterized protein MYCGRDRAFT_34239 [Zymoseptoria tritici IPO323]EGP91679.1 hypothetical protein MYCGRDRAFT_34239 [Zymoseptoria tritici IPO323]SMR45280.1 unnamed protein product [Zymoseptoria tritici ST99CH_3D1]